MCDFSHCLFVADRLCFQIFSAINAPTQLVYRSLQEGVNLGSRKIPGFLSSLLTYLWLGYCPLESLFEMVGFSVIRMFFRFSRELQTIVADGVRRGRLEYTL
jgi:hypothetical protein